VRTETSHSQAHRSGRLQTRFFGRHADFQVDENFSEGRTIFARGPGSQVIAVELYTEYDELLAMLVAMINRASDWKP